MAQRVLTMAAASRDGKYKTTIYGYEDEIDSGIVGQPPIRGLVEYRTAEGYHCNKIDAVTWKVIGHDDDDARAGIIVKAVGSSWD